MRAQLEDFGRRAAAQFTDSKLAKRFVAPRLAKPISAWYRDNFLPDAIADLDTTDHAVDQAVQRSPDVSQPKSPRVVPIEPAAPATAAETISAEAPTGLLAIPLALKTRIAAHNLTVVAAGIAFWGLLAIPALLTAALSIYGLIADEQDATDLIDGTLSSLPDDAASILGKQLTAVAGSSGGGLAVGVVVGIALALWTTSGAVAKLIATLNTIWDATETRKFLQLRGLALTLTFAAIMAVAGTGFALAILPAILDRGGLGDSAQLLIGLARYPAILVLMTVGLALLYSLGPNRDARLRFISVGAVVATVLWLFVSWLFTIYTGSFASYNETYAGLGGIVVLLLWLFITAFMVLLGAEVDAAIEEAAKPSR